MGQVGLWRLRVTIKLSFYPPVICRPYRFIYSKWCWRYRMRYNWLFSGRKRQSSHGWNNYVYHSALLCKCLCKPVVTLKLRKQWTCRNKFQDYWLCSDQSHLSSGHASKPQNHKLITVSAVCSLVFSHDLLAFSSQVNTIIFHYY